MLNRVSCVVYLHCYDLNDLCKYTPFLQTTKKNTIWIIVNFFVSLLQSSLTYRVIRLDHNKLKTMNNEKNSYGRYDHFDDFDEVTIYDTYCDGYVKSTFYYPAVVDLDGSCKSDPVHSVNVSKEKCKWRWDVAKSDWVLALEYKINRNRFVVERH